MGTTTSPRAIGQGLQVLLMAREERQRDVKRHAAPFGANGSAE